MSDSATFTSQQPEETDAKPLEVAVPWERGRVGDAAEDLVDGDWIESKDMDEDGNIQLVQLAHIGEGRFKGNPHRFITRDFAGENNCTLLNEGDLLISRMQAPILRSCLLPEFPNQSVMAVDIARLIPKAGWNKLFMMYLFNSRPVWKQAIAWASGTTRKRISRKNIERLRLPNPPLDEQRKIASVLYTVDQAIEKTEEIVEQAKRVKKGLLNGFFGRGEWWPYPSDETRSERIGPLRFEVPDHWGLTQISSIGEVITGDTPSTSEEGNFGGHLPFVTPETLSHGKYITESRRTLSEEGRNKAKPIPADSVMMDCIGSDMGKVSLAGCEVATNQQINSVVIQTSSYLPEFLYYHLQLLSDFIKSQAGQTATPIVNKSTFESFEIFHPPVEEQQEIVKMLACYDETIRLGTDYVSVLKRLKRGLMQDLLTGKVRTVDKAIEVLDEVAAHG